MTDPVNIPDGILSSDFPAPADRTAGVFNSKALAWANSARDMSERDREIALAGRTNAIAAKEGADAAVPAAAQAVAARNDAVPAAAQAVAARDEAVPAAAQALDAAQRAEDAAASIEDGPVTSVNGKTGVVNLGIADVVAPGDIVAYGPTKQDARAQIDAGLDYARGHLVVATSQNINKSIFGTATIVIARLRSGGGSGSAQVNTNSSGVGGAEGGHSVDYLIRVADLPASIPCVVGAGGAAIVAVFANSAVQPGQAGGDTVFATVYRVPGGLGGSGSFGALNRGLRAGSGGAGGGAAQVGAIYREFPGPGSNSLRGGGGGGSGANSADAAYRVAGTSVDSGSGGAGAFGATVNMKAVDGQYPSGGGGGCVCTLTGNASATATSGAGGAGNIELWWF